MKRNLVLIFCFLFAPFLVCAQFKISGRVVGADDHQPLPNVSVFINNTTIGSNTDVNGRFNLTNIKPGKYDVVISMVGFSASKTTLSITARDVDMHEIALLPNVNSLKEIKITARQDPERDKYIEMFQRTFLGSSSRAAQCKILNPELLDFHYDKETQILYARSVDFLIIENKALGYKISYLLTDFHYDQVASQFGYEGPVHFEMLPASKDQETNWDRQRNEAYNNTIVRFLKAASENRLSDNGFTVFRLTPNPERQPDSVIQAKLAYFSAAKREKGARDSIRYWEKQEKLPKLAPKQDAAIVTASELISQRDRPGIYSFDCEQDPLLIVYRGETHEKIKPSDLRFDNESANSLVFFNKPTVFFDAKGNILNPGSLSYTGAWANQRVADLLPTDFQPEDKPVNDLALHDKIDTVLNTHLVEKGYLQLDKPFYMGGDTIYFKAYLQQSNLKPGDIETQLNVELSKPSGANLEKQRLRVRSGVAAGDFALPDSLGTGLYNISVYTNASPECPQKLLFEQWLPVAGMNKLNAKTGIPAGAKLSRPLAIAGLGKRDIDIQFFAEGGNFLAGYNNKVAFKAINKLGAGVEVSGVVTDEAGQQVCTFKSNRLGMGYTEFKPEQSKIYKATVSSGNHSMTVSLPKANTTGYLFSVNNTDPRQLSLNVIAATAIPRLRVSILGESNGHICYFSSPVVKDGKLTTNILTDGLPQGIIRFTLFTNVGEPVNERLVFIKKARPLNLSLPGLQDSYTTRAKTLLHLKCTDGEGKAIAGNFSVSVTNESVVPVSANTENTIYTQLLLKSDLNGFVEEPGYYFTDAPGVNDDLDALMLTQGYSEFQWKSIMKDTPALACMPQEGTFVSGIIKDQNGKPMSNAAVSMTSVSRKFFSIDTVADTKGRFLFRRYPVDSMRYIIQATDKLIRKKTVIELDNISNRKFSAETPTEADSLMIRQLTAYANAENRFLNIQTEMGFGKHGVVLKEVGIKERKQLNVPHSDNLNGAGVASDVIRGDQLPRGCLLFKDCLANHLHGIKYRDGSFYYNYLTTLVIVDGIEIPSNLKFQGLSASVGDGPSHSDVLDLIPPANIATVEIITDASYGAIYGSKSGGGVIIVTTKNISDVSTKSLPVSYQYYTPQSYHKMRVFYSPQYDRLPVNPKLQDLRTTVYWKPIVKTDGSADSNIEFYNPDQPGVYRIVIEGLDESGNPVRAVYHYNIN